MTGTRGRVLPILFAATIAGCAINSQPGQQSPRVPTHTVTTPPSTSPQAGPPAAAPPTTEEPSVDKRGFKGTRARCDPDDTAALIAHTDRSILVICQSSGRDHYYYRAVRVSDGASIDLSNAVRTADGFDATNPADGTRYRVTHKQLEVTLPNGQKFTEPMIAFVKPR